MDWSFIVVVFFLPSVLMPFIGRVCSLVMLATSAGDVAVKSDRRYALFSSMAGSCGAIMVPGRFPSPSVARIFFKLSSVNSLFIFSSNDRIKFSRR